jgi:Uma2 family endonuclease
MPTAKKNLLTIEEYLAQEETDAVRHEYINGRLFAMTGATRRHNTIISNITTIVRPHLRGTSCRVYSESVKVRVEATNSFYYPDVMISCDPYGKNSVSTSEPVLIIEVSSPSTAAIDRREKLFAYMQLDSLKEYLIVHHRTKRVQMHRRDADGLWETSEFCSGEEILLESVPTGTIMLKVDAIYEDVDYPGIGDPSLTVREEDEEYDADW